MYPPRFHGLHRPVRAVRGLISTALPWPPHLHLSCFWYDGECFAILFLLCFHAKLQDVFHRVRCQMNSKTCGLAWSCHKARDLKLRWTTISKTEISCQTTCHHCGCHCNIFCTSSAWKTFMLRRLRHHGNERINVLWNPKETILVWFTMCFSPKKDMKLAGMISMQINADVWFPMWKAELGCWRTWRIQMRLWPGIFQWWFMQCTYI